MLKCLCIEFLDLPLLLDYDYVLGYKAAHFIVLGIVI